MNSRLPCLPLVWLALAGGDSSAYGQPAPHPRAENQTRDATPAPPYPASSVYAPAPNSLGGPGDSLLGEAIAAMQSHSSIRAAVRHRAHLFGTSAFGKGIYLQQGRGAQLRIRYELQTQIEQSQHSCVQIADGRYLWTDQGLGEERTVSRVDLGRLRAASSKTKGSASGPIASGLAMGGLPKLLAALADHYQFANPRPGSLGDLPVWVLAGRLRAANDSERSAGRETVAEEDADANRKAAGGHVANEVLVYLARKDLFPCVVEYRHQATGPRGVRQSGPSEPGALLRMELYDVRIGEPLDPRKFVYVPGRIPALDGTDELVERLRMSRKPRAPSN